MRESYLEIVPHPETGAPEVMVCVRAVLRSVKYAGMTIFAAEGQVEKALVAHDHRLINQLAAKMDRLKREVQFLKSTSNFVRR